MAVVTARGLRKTFGSTVALDGVDLTIDEGRIVGLIGPNGAGKSTALGAILGLIPFEGELTVMGRNPWTARDELMKDVCFIADVAVLPRWMKVSDAVDYVAGVHPRFDRAKAESFLAKTTIKKSSRVRALSKGMVAQLHLALVMAIDAKLLVLDEPTLGLDLLYRKAFYDTLLNDYHRHHSPGRRDPGHPDRHRLHRPRPHRAQPQDGGHRDPLHRTDGAARRGRHGQVLRSDP
jgi:ABC-2 type transport system ATP-binding protein